MFIEVPSACIPLLYVDRTLISLLIGVAACVSTCTVAFEF